MLRMLIVGAVGFAAAGVALRLARAGFRRGAVLPLRHGRLCAGDAVVVAGAQICREPQAAPTWARHCDGAMRRAVSRVAISEIRFGTQHRPPPERSSGIFAAVAD